MQYLLLHTDDQAFGRLSPAAQAEGPFAESKEQIAGYYLIEADDEVAALGWAKRCPTARHGAVELRPVHVT